MAKLIKRQETCTSLENAKAINVVLALFKHPEPLKFNELIQVVGGSATTVSMRVRNLKKAGLIKENKLKKFPYTRTFSFTPRGMVMAEKLCELEAVCGEKSERKLKTMAKKVNQKKYQIPLIITERG